MNNMALLDLSEIILSFPSKPASSTGTVTKRTVFFVVGLRREGRQRPNKRVVLKYHDRGRSVVVPAQDTLRIIVGAAEDRYEGWLSTDKHGLNLVREADWAFHFEPNTVDAVLAEHVWEHLEAHDAVTAAQLCFTYLKPGGYVRVAVPDGLHPDEGYIHRVKPGGWGAGSDDHQVLYTYRTLRDVFASIGFDTRLLEYFDEQGTFYYQDWSPVDGMITRSSRFDSRIQSGVLAYTSIILDARKQI